MTIPEEVGEFFEPTLVAVAGSVQAKLFLAKGHAVTALETVEARPGEAFFERLSENLKTRLDKEEFVRLALSVPEDMTEELENSLHIALLKVTDVILPKLLTNTEPVDIAVEVLDAI